MKRDAVPATNTVTELSQPTTYDWAAGATKDYPIHASCNSTQRSLLKKGLDDAMKLADHAKNHVLRFGNSSEFYVKYFGSAPTAEVIGWYDKVVNADRGGIWFRCDNPDGNCDIEGWGGHWRGENGTDETVICELSYTTRMPIEGLCGYGYDVSNGELAFYFGSDLIHRLYHMPKIGEAIVEHYADTYSECLELAVDAPAEAVRNSHTLQYFALDVYAYDIALPGEGCTGRVKDSETSTDEPTATASSSASATECHTHSDGTEHCE
ncbi:putative peptidase domain-containing protein [Pseudomassariella vexata]|uniref:Putative peptidase domain-containing protein n=1 Tax=Pseudomassariella vexata TaxID=1141098 RepID=A0A1Y2DXG6_9PEZI|nr:putative peptidase domain-containing protein [Pseudomassariella vexata]ORY63937.1 putative peptidase domain-containing protein [Pseudomassariella vexata]